MVSRRKELFKGRNRNPIRRRPSILTENPRASTTTSSSLRTSSRFVVPQEPSTPQILSTGSRSRGILGRPNPQPARGLLNRRPSPPKQATPVSEPSSSTTSIQQLQQQLKEQQQRLHRLQESPSDEGGGGESTKQGAQNSRGRAQQSNSSKFRCRFFRNSNC